MDLQCSICREIAACVHCECASPSVSICQTCLPVHITNPGLHAQCTFGTQDSCSADGNPAFHFCLCNSYVCSDCLPVHHPHRDNHYVFPMSLLPIFHQDNTGALLRQGELIEEFAAALQKQAKGLREKLVQKVTDTFDELQRHLQERRVHTLEQVTQYAKEFESESEVLLEKLSRMKYRAGWQAESELEALIQREDRKELAEYQSDIVGWVFEMEEYKRKWKSLSRLRNWRYLLAPPSYEPCCIAVANGKTQLFALPSVELLPVRGPLAWLDGCLLCLPSIEWFFCDSQLCHIITADFSDMQSLCVMKEERRYAGLAHYRNCVYLFGGLNQKISSCTAECVDIDSKQTRLLGCGLPCSFFAAMPCRQDNQLYFGSTMCSTKSFRFNLITEKIELMPFNFEETGFSEALAFPDEEVVILSKSKVYSFHCRGTECYPLSETVNFEYIASTAPVKLQGIWYFMCKREDWLLLQMPESTRELQQVAELEEMDLIQRILSRGQLTM